MLQAPFRRHGRAVVVIAMLTVPAVLTACAPIVSAGASSAPAPIAQAVAGGVATETATPEPTATAEPTATLEPTATPEPVIAAAPAAAPDPAVIAAGVAVYRKQYCGICHTLSLIPTTGTFGPPHDHVATTALARIADPAYTGAAHTAEEYLRESLLDPHVFIVPGYATGMHPMPQYAFLGEHELDALVKMLLAQK